MIKLPFVLLFTALTALSWGVYGIVLHRGTDLLAHSSLRAFIGVGIAYFLIAVLIPLIWLGSKKEKGYWSITGSILSLLAGTVGALGALGVTLAVAFKGSPIYVMPIVFGGAPVVNTLVTSWINKSYSQIKPLFIFGMILVALGMIGVLQSKPSNPPSHTAAVATQEGEGNPSQPKAEALNPFAIGGSILLAVVCWGAYGPVLHLGQMKMGGSRLRPFCCVGMAYFLIAVVVPLLILMTTAESVDLTMRDALWGLGWSILAGAAGAIGALGIILAFNYGGKPVFVMPLVFGFAPVVNTLVSMALSGSLGSITPFFAGSLLLGITGAATVLIFAPKAKPHAPASTPAATPAPSPPASTLPTPERSLEPPKT